jgi:hypothetical protein
LLVRGHRQLTDVYLLGLAVRHGGRLVTFDQSIPIASVRGATRASLEVIAPAEPTTSRSQRKATASATGIS